MYVPYRLQFPTFFCIVATISLPLASPADETVDRFRRDAPSSWQKYLSFLNTLDGTVTVGLTTNGFSGKSRVEVRQDGTRKRCVTEVLSGPMRKGPGRGRLAVVMNDEYSFQLGADADSPKWAITSLAMKNADGWLANEKAVKQPLTNLEVLIRLTTWRLPDLLERGSFRIISAAEITEQGQAYVIVKFDNSHPFEEQPFCPIQRGEVTLDPAHAWCIKRADFTSLFADDTWKETKMETQYSEARDGFPLPLIVRNIAKTKSGDGTTGESTWEFKAERLMESSGHKPNDFTLSAFGLPEPPGFEKRGWPISIWIALGGFVFVTAGLAIRRFLRLKG